MTLLIIFVISVVVLLIPMPIYEILHHKISEKKVKKAESASAAAAASAAAPEATAAT
jgi:hypothetical protein